MKRDKLIIFLMLFSISAIAIDVKTVEKLKNPYREFSIIIGEQGYFPKVISVFQGEKVRFFITSMLKDPSCFMMPEKNVFVAATAGKISETEITFDKTGKYYFSCPTGQITGTILVLDKKIKEENPVAQMDQQKIKLESTPANTTVSRGPASIKDKTVQWMPREE